MHIPLWYWFRKNRDSSIGVFVFSKRTAPKDILDPLTHCGDDVVAIWDAEDPATDTYLGAALSIAKALCVRGVAGSGGLGIDIEALDKAVPEIERQAGGLEEITKSAEAIDGHVGRILDRARIMRNGLDRQVNVLDEKVGGLKELLNTME